MAFDRNPMSFNSTGSAPAPRARTVPLALFGVAVLVAAGAAVAATAAYFELRPAPAPASSVSVTDDLGRSVEVPRDPARVVVLSPSIMDSVVRLGLRAHVVGVDCSSAAFGGLEADYTSDQVAAWNLTPSLCVQIVGSVNTEDLLNKSPDLVLTSTIVSLSDIEEISGTYHLPVVVLAPATASGIVLDVDLLGSIFGVPTPASGLAAELTSVLANASAVVENLTQTGASLPTVLLTYYVTPVGSPLPGYFTFGPGTFGESLVELAGGSSISANSTTPYPELSGSQVLSANPTKVLYATGFGLNLSSYAAGPDWSGLGAVQDGHAFAVDSTLVTEAGPSMILEGLHLLLHLLHPDLVPA